MEKTAGVSIIEPVPLLADEVFVRNPPVSETGGGDISVLSVSPFPDDPDAVERILHPPQWNVHKARTLKSAMAVFKRNRPPLIVCECNLGQETWRELLAEITLTPEPPLLIVASRLADDYLWAEALNLGAYDVLAKPFDQAELTRTLTSAWLHWLGQQGAARPSALSSAGSGWQGDALSKGSGKWQVTQKWWFPM
jgi:CheY-like chemotaxis protein